MSNQQPTSPRQFDQCPLCRGNSVWWLQLHYIHLMRCQTCSHSFNPREQWEQDEVERLAMNTMKE